MSKNVDRVKSNIQKMVDGGADEIEINQYLKTEGFTPDSFSKALQVSGKAGKSTAEYGAGRAALQGLTFNTADEMEAALKAYAGQGTYDQNLAALKLAKEEYEKQNPKTAIAAEVVGGLPYAAVPFLGAARYAQMAKAASPAVKAAVLTGANIGTGAVTGGLAGAGSADIGQRAAGARTGAAVGGAIGSAIPAVSATAGKVGQKVVDVTSGIPVVQRAGQAVGALTGQSIDYANRAKEKLLEAMSRDKVTPSEIEDVLRSITKPVGLPDVAGENVRSLADVVQKYPSAARQEGRRALEERGAGQAERVKSDISKYLGENRDPYEVAKEISERQRSQAAPLYKSAYEKGAVINNPDINKFFELPQFQDAYKKAQRIAALEGDVLPDLSKGAPIDLRTLDYVKRGLDDIIQGGNQTGGLVGSELSALTKRKKEFVSLLDNEVPEYGEARKVWAGEQGTLEAVDAGKDFFKLSSSEAKRTLDSLNPAEKDAFRIGAIDALRNRIETGKDTADTVKRIFGSTEERNRIKSLFPDEDSFAKFSKDMQTEATMRMTQEKVLRGSQTAERQLGMQGLEQEPTFFSQIFEQGPVKGSLNYLRAQGQGVAGQTAEELSPFLFTLGNQEKNLLNMQALKEYEQELLRRAALKAAATTGASTGIPRVEITNLLGED